MRLIFLLLSSVICFIVMLQNDRVQNSLFDFTYIVIVFWSLFAIFNERNLSFSLYKIFYTFVLLFFGIAPYIQFTNGTVLWKVGKDYSDTDYLLTNLIIILILLVFEFVYSQVFKTITFNKKTEIRNGYNSIIPIRLKIILFLLSSLSFLMALAVNDFSIVPLFIRGGDSFDIDITYTPFIHVVFNYFRPMAIIIFMVYFSLFKKFDFLAVFLLVMGIIINFPTGISRYSAAALYIPLLLIIFPILRKKYNFNILLIASFLIIFPFLNNFRYITDDSQFKLRMNFEMFNEGHFDSYSSLLRVIKYDVVTNGEQLLGVLFFWIPRNLWLEKPIGSGAFMANELGLIYTNISANYFAEGYVNFGFCGVILFTILLAILLAYFDKKYIINQMIRSTFHYFSIYYYLMAGFLIFILRGDLLSSIAYISGYLSANYTIVLLVKSVIKYKS